MMSDEELIHWFGRARQPLPAVLRWWGRAPQEQSAAVLLGVAAGSGALADPAEWRELVRSGQEWARQQGAEALALALLLSGKQTAGAQALAAVLLETIGESLLAAEQFKAAAGLMEGELRALALLSSARLYVQKGERSRAVHRWTQGVKSSSSTRTLGVADKLLRQFERSGEMPSRRRCRIAMVGSVTLDLLIPPLRVICLAHGIRAELWTGGFGQHVQELLDPTSGLAAFKPDIVIIACDWRTLSLPDEVEEPSVLAKSNVAAFRPLWQACRERLRAHVIQFNFEVPACSPYGRLSGALPGGAGRVIRGINGLLFDAESTVPGLTVVDIDHLASCFGKQRWYDPALWYAAKQYPAPEALPALAKNLTALLRAVLGLTGKCLVLDLDNTLWGGVIGEDGLAGIKLGGESTGEAYVAFQKYLLGLKRRGIVLAVCSKNNEADARLPFEAHPDMALKAEDITLFVANWRPKDENLRYIARTLNLGLDSLVFVDDNPAERAWVQQQIPEVEVVDLPVDPARYIEALEQNLPFEVLGLSAEDRQRVQTYRENQERETLREQSATVEDFLEGLDMTVELRRFDATNLPRVVQLINKTNQFNLTTRRFSENQVAGLVGTQAYTQAVRLRDRYGDYGLTGVLIAQPEGTALRITVWLMSCRIIGRCIEKVMLAALVRDARVGGFTQLIGEYVPSPKNAMVSDLYPRLGFVPGTGGEKDGLFYEYDLSRELTPFPKGLRISS